MEQANTCMELISAARRGDKATVKRLVATGVVNVNVTDENGVSPLWISSFKGHLDVVKILIKAGAKVNLTTEGIATPLYVASQKGYHEVVQTLLDAGADVDIGRSDTNATPLDVACQNGHHTVVQMLLKAGADATFDDGSTILHYAAKHDWQDEIEYILNNSTIDVNSANDDGHTALHHAAIFGNVECANLLIKNSSNVNVQSNAGNTPLHRAVSNGHVKVVEALLIHPDIQVDLANNNKETALMKASETGNAVCVKMLMNAGARVDMRDKDGNTALMKASANKHMECVKVLTDINADINMQDNQSPNLTENRIDEAPAVQPARPPVVKPPHPAPSPDQTSSQATKVYVKFYADLKKKVNPSDIAAELLAKHLITEDEHDDITNMMWSSKVRMNHLLSAVKRAILIKAENFYIFLDVLGKAGGGKYDDLVKEMEDSLRIMDKEEQQLTQAQLPGPSPLLSHSPPNPKKQKLIADAPERFPAADPSVSTPFPGPSSNPVGSSGAQIEVLKNGTQQSEGTNRGRRGRDRGRRGGDRGRRHKKK